MSLKKQFLKSRPVCKVTFRLTAEAVVAADSVSLVGDFNDWSGNAHPMRKLKNGSFTTTIDLEAGRTYQFRYLIDGDKWENDWEADEYTAGPFAGAENSVVRV